MKKISLIFLILFFLELAAQADEMYIVDVHRNIPLSDEDPVYKDFAISFSDSSSLKKNLVVNVKRKLTVKDASSKPVGELETTVGQIRIIQVDKKVAIGREYKLTPREDEVVLDQIGILTGDRIDLAGAFSDSKPAKKERHPTSQTLASGEKADAILAKPEKNSTEKPPTTELLQIRLNPLAIPEI